jgi:hypothetical protein
MNSAIDPIGSIVGYGKSPKTTRANQAEEEEQIGLIKKLEEEESESGKNGHRDAYQGSAQEKKDQASADAEQSHAATTAQEAQVVATDEDTNEQGDESEGRKPLRHIDVKA